MKFWGWTLFLCAFLSFLGRGPQPVVAQTPDPPLSTAADLQIQQIRVQVMPEFDDPRVLVIVQGRFADTGAAFPTPVTFWIPRGAQINQMAEMDQTTGAIKSRPFDAQSDPDDRRWSWVTYTLGNPHFFYEYYCDPLEGETDKHFIFAWGGPYAVDELLLEVQEPLAATRFTLEPPATIARFDERFAMTYHQLNGQTLMAGEIISVAVSYTKADPDPSLTREEVMALMEMDRDTPEPAAMAKDASAGNSWPDWVFVLLGGGVLILVGVLIWYRTQLGGEGARLRYRRVSEAASESHAGLSASPAPVYCSQCRAILKSNARFCHVCGAACEDVSG